MMIEFQRLILGDRLRNEAFVEALRRTIVPGRTTVADLGSGTGFLAFLASRLGAKHCFLYEQGDLLDLSREIARDNRIRNCTFVRAHSTEVKRPPRVDLVVSETVGNLALEENLLETLQDGRRFLKPGGTTIPQKLRQFVAPVLSARHFAALDLWPRIGYDLDFRAARRVSLHNAYVRTIERSDLLDSADAARAFDEVDFRERAGSVRRATVEWRLERPARLFGFALWWECELLAEEPRVLLSTEPGAAPTHWEQIWLPPLEPLEASAGETLRLSIECDSRLAVRINLKWRTALLDPSGRPRVETAQDMRKGNVQ
jgi:protein arginine N-methyltransferase 1